jgi:flagellar biosynthetic protein FliQ
MTADLALNFLNDMLWAALLVAAPVLLAMLLVGLLISVVQVTTQLQEVTLSYVPKILVSAFILIAIGPWMMERVTTFATSLYGHIPELAR